MPLLLPWLLLAQPAVASVCTDNQIAALTCTSPARSGRLEVIQGGGQFTYVTPNEFERYTCNGQQIGVVEDGPEHIYRFTCAHDTQVTAQVSGLACDADLFVLEPCAAGTCTVASVHPGRANEQLTFACHPGHEYWVTVEAPSLGLPFVPFCPGFIPLGSPQTVRLHYVTDYTLTTSCAEDCGNAIDDDEDGLVDCADPGCSGQPACCDRDGDRANATGGCGGADCNDNDATIFPNAPEIVDDGVDQDCDGRDGCYQDRDLDGWGSAVVVPGALTGCGAPSVSAVGGDCLDVGAGADQIHPGAPDPVADGLDQDCDGVDTCWVDLDGDGWGSTTGPGGNLTCTGVDGFAPQGGDCMDGGVGSALVHPGAFEVCNGLDDDCDGLSDDDDNAAGGRLWYRDVDGDGYGVPSPTVIACAPPPGYAATSDDCDDLGVDGASIHPDAEDTPANGRDEDCDGRDACYVDVDLDGFGGPIAAPGDNLVCGDALGEAVDSSDCLDQGPGSAAVHPGGVEVCNGLDDDCDGLTDDD
ncbi:MAG TPA: MopE-related protein, partial [Myxococcota bacterium]|nr:MopE-related protein [Myxococcota bacterium]